MRFAPIVPTKYLNTLASLSTLQMCLAQKLGSRKYLNFYRKRRNLGDTVILDNGAFELGTSISPEELLEAFKLLGGTDYVVIPDTHSGDNLKLFKSFSLYGEFREINPSVEFIAVPHNLHELDFMLGMGMNYVIGIGKELVTDRKKLFRNIKSNKRFYILGLRRDPLVEVRELKQLVQFGINILGVDSSLPYRLTRLGRRLYEYRPYPPPIDFGENNLSNERVRFCVEELKWFIDWVEHGDNQT